MAEVWTMGEMLVEIMRPGVDVSLYDTGEFLGPYPSGSPAIFADAVARLGHSSGIFGGVGDDEFGHRTIDHMTANGVDCSHVHIDKQLSTAVAFNTYFSDGGRKFIFHIGNTAAALGTFPEDIDTSDVKFFHIMGSGLCHAENFTEEILKALKTFKAAGAKVSFDPNLRPELLKGRDAKVVLAEVIRNCNVLLPGEDEILSLAGKDTVEESVEELFKNSELEVIAVKRGSKGSTVFTREESFDMGVYKIEAKDATGAGDCFDAGFVAALIEGKDLRECAKWGSAAAAINTAAFGTMQGDISPENVRKMIEG